MRSPAGRGGERMATKKKVAAKKAAKKPAKKAAKKRK
jgi:hypothetical protein